MPQATVSFPSVSTPKECVYTQTLGVQPDVATLRFVPQAGAVPATGTLTFSWNGSSITLPNCLVDSTKIQYGERGMVQIARILDRRWRWHRAAPISGYYNVVRGGTIVASTQQSLRTLAEYLLNQMGEASPDVSALSNSIYPEVRWDAESPALALDQLLKEWGFNVALGFGSEVVTVVQLGTGAALSTTDAMMISNSVDPPTRPQYARIVFDDSLAQYRVKLTAVGLETDDTWVPINSLSYKPAAGWGGEDPETLPTVNATGSADVKARANFSVFRAYKIDTFADGSLTAPDGTTVLDTIEQLLPLQNRLLVDEEIRVDGSPIPWKLYGKYLPRTENVALPQPLTPTAIGDQITGLSVRFYGELGLIIFEKPMFWVNSGVFTPAELYLEVTSKFRDADNNAYARYTKDVLIDASGFGYHTVKFPQIAARTVAAYNSSQVVTGTSTNIAALDAAAALMAASVSSQYVTTGQAMAVYNHPVLTLRCDGAIQQVQHIITDGSSYGASMSVASRNQEFDRFIRGRDERLGHIYAVQNAIEGRGQYVLQRRKDTADD